MKMYSIELSGHSHKARLMASILGLDIEIINVDFKSGEHKDANFLKKNPFGQVPVLEDGEVFINDSNAIIYYLACKYDRSKTYVPVDPILCAQIQVWLSKASNELANSIAAARRIAIFNNSTDHEDLKVKSHKYLEIIDKHLSGREWLVGLSTTIADISLYTYISHAPEGGICLDKYENIKHWLSRIEKLEGFFPFPEVETEALKLLKK